MTGVQTCALPISPAALPFASRRDFLTRSWNGLGSLALTGLAAQEARSDGDLPNPLAGQSPHIPRRAKHCIFLYMEGGPSHIDTFDPKAKLEELHLKEFNRSGEEQSAMSSGKRYYVKSPFEFHKTGQSGADMNKLWKNLAEVADDLCFYRGLQVESVNHPTANYHVNTGNRFGGDPAIGSWVNYGLGTENTDLPGFVVMLDPRGGPISGAKNWTSGYMPADFQATVLRSKGNPILDLAPPDDMSREVQRTLLDTLGEYNLEHSQPRIDNSNLAARIASYELAYRMQAAAPEAVDLSSESEKTLEMYGLKEKVTEPFGRQCLLARRLVERGVRFVQIYSGGNHNVANCDAHRDLKPNHDMHAAETDKPVSALLTDLKQRGMLKDTLVVWGGEFGRQPTAEYEKGTGRDHNSYGFTMWMAGGGIKGGISVGKTDELGSAAVEDRSHVKQLHATILHQLGLDPNRLSYFYNGLDQKLVGVERVEPIRQIL